MSDVEPRRRDPHQGASLLELFGITMGTRALAEGEAAALRSVREKPDLLADNLLRLVRRRVVKPVEAPVLVARFGSEISPEVTASVVATLLDRAGTYDVESATMFHSQAVHPSGEFMDALECQLPEGCFLSAFLGAADECEVYLTPETVAAPIDEPAL